MSQITKHQKNTFKKERKSTASFSCYYNQTKDKSPEDQRRKTTSTRWSMQIGFGFKTTTKKKDPVSTASSSLSKKIKDRFSNFEPMRMFSPSRLKDCIEQKFDLNNIDVGNVIDKVEELNEQRSKKQMPKKQQRHGINDASKYQIKKKPTLDFGSNKFNRHSMIEQSAYKSGFDLSGGSIFQTRQKNIPFDEPEDHEEEMLFDLCDEIEEDQPKYGSFLDVSNLNNYQDEKQLISPVVQTRNRFSDQLKRYNQLNNTGGEQSLKVLDQSGVVKRRKMLQNAKIAQITTNNPFCGNHERTMSIMDNSKLSNSHFGFSGVSTAALTPTRIQQQDYEKELDTKRTSSIRVNTLEGKQSTLKVQQTDSQTELEVQSVFNRDDDELFDFYNGPQPGQEGPLIKQMDPFQIIDQKPIKLGTEESILEEDSSSSHSSDNDVDEHRSVLNVTIADDEDKDEGRFDKNRLVKFTKNLKKNNFVNEKPSVPIESWTSEPSTPQMEFPSYQSIHETERDMPTTIRMDAQLNKCFEDFMKEKQQRMNIVVADSQRAHSGQQTANFYHSRSSNDRNMNRSRNDNNSRSSRLYQTAVNQTLTGCDFSDQEYNSNNLVEVTTPQMTPQQSSRREDNHNEDADDQIQQKIIDVVIYGGKKQI